MFGILGVLITENYVKARYIHHLIVMAADWAKKPIKNILLDINGVLFNSGEDFPIEGSVDALKRLVESGFKFCLVTNECTTPKRLLAKRLNSFGYSYVDASKIVSPAPVACRYLIEHNLIPRLHVWDDILEDFQPALERLKSSKEPANCLVIGDVMSKLSRDFIDESLEIMLNCPTTPTIISMGAGRYYKDAARLRMDTGAFTKAFEYCLNVQAVNIGKPSGDFFRTALEAIGGNESETIMIGDDILSDVGAAQKLGMRGFLVRTGKYKRSDETEMCVTADYVFDDLKATVDAICKQTW